MDRKEKMVVLKCDCGCSMFVAEKTVWEDGDVNYNLSLQDSRYDHNNATLLGRVKGAFKILFGKPIYYSDVFIDNPERFKDFIRDLDALYDAEL